jgi:uncharacterized protein YraI
MRKVLFTAALVAAALPLSPAMARQMTGYTVRQTEIVSGPSADYPAVRSLNSDARVTVYGCLSDWSWCDVSYSYDRGWVARDDIVIGYQGHRSRIMPYMGIGILAFTFGAYWDDHYRGRPFYSDRARWQQNYTQNFRPAWGGRAPSPSGARPGGHQRQGSPYQGQYHQAPAAPHFQGAPAQHSAPTIRAAPHGNWGATPHHQGGQHQQHVAPMMRAAPVRQAAPAHHGGGQQSHPQGGAPQERPHGNAGGEHKPRG